MINRTVPPTEKGNISFDIPKINLVKSSTGAQVYFVQKEKLPIIQLSVLFSCGSKFDPVDKRGLAYLTSLMFDEGAAEYDALQLNNEFEKLGTVLSVSSDHDIFSLSILSLKENFQRSIELLSKIINQPRFEEKDFKREKKKLLDRILQLKDEPSYIASTVFDSLIFKNSYYEFPEIGIERGVNEITIDDIISFYRENILKSNLQIVVTGNITEAELLELIDKYLIKNTNTLKQPKFLQPVKNNTNFYLIDKKDSAQSEIRIGHISKPRNAKDFYATIIMNTLLGGQFSSRINLNLREQKGFTYGANSSFNYLRDAGYFEVSTAVNIQNSGEAISEILKELNAVRLNITKEEIRFAKSYLVKQFPSRFETYTQIAKNIVSLIVHSLPTDYYNGYTVNLESTTEGEIFEAANDNIFPNQLIVLAVGDKKLIEPQLKMISNGNLTELDLDGTSLL